MISVAAGFGEHVDLRRFMAEFRGVDAGLHLEFLNGVDGGKHDVGVEIRVRVDDAVEREVVEKDAIPAGRDRLVGAIATLARLGLTGRRRERIGIRISATRFR